jgi:hypothetical protein
MTDYKIGETHRINGWILRERKGHLELWYNPKSGNYSTELYEHEMLDENMLLHAIRHYKKDAYEMFYLVSDIIT